MALVALVATACTSSQDTAQAATGGQASDEQSSEVTEPTSTDDESAEPNSDEPKSAVASELTEAETDADETDADETDADADTDSAETDGDETAIGASTGGLKPVEPGTNGDDVVALQERLAEIGFAPGPADGAYGQRTTDAIEAFQLLVDLDQTGEADAATIKALRDYSYTGLVLHAGDEGPKVEELQKQLAGGPFDPGPVDGKYGTATVEAVWALEKLAGVPVDGDWGPLDEQAWQKLTDGKIGRPAEDHELRWVEVDLSAQLMKVYDPGATAPILVSHISSGSGQAWSNASYSGNSVTPVGDFEIDRRIAGWRESSLNIGRLYNPLYFNGGIAFHGALSVPLYPASHGCIRVPMHIAEYLPAELENGTPVHVMA